MLNSGMFSSNTGEWSTPKDLIEFLEYEFGKFTLDAAATKENAICDKFYTREDNGLFQPWHGRVYCNPPYGREIGKWVAQGFKYTSRLVHTPAEIVVMLLPARTDTSWWHRYCMHASRVLFIEGRLKFGGSKNSAPFPSAIVVFHGPGECNGVPIQWVRDSKFGAIEHIKELEDHGKFSRRLVYYG